MSATRTTLAALLMLAGALSAPGCAPAGSGDPQFESALRAYLEIARGDDTDAAQRLYELGKQTNNAQILRDATYAAISQRDLELALRAGEAWHEAGGEEALLLLTRMRISAEGLSESLGILKRLAAEAGSAEVYEAVRTASSRPDRVASFRSAHPLHLREDEYYAYLALLTTEASLAGDAVDAVRTGLEHHPDSVPLLVVALFLAEIAGQDEQSIDLATKLAVAAETDEAVAVIVYSQWAAAPADQRPLLPDRSSFEIEDEAHSDLALLYAGRFYLRHGEPLTTVEILQQVDPNAPNRPDAVRMLVAAYQQLGEGYVDTTLGLLRRELDRVPAEVVPELAELYASIVEKRDGLQPAYEFLRDLRRALDNPDMLFLRSIYAERVGRLDEAESLLRRLIALAPESSVGYNALGYLFAQHSIRLEEGLQLINKALEIEPDSAAIIDSLGWVLYRLGDLDGALLHLEDSVRRMGEQPHPEVLAHLVEVLWELGEQSRARAVLSVALRIDPNDESVQKVVAKYQLDGEPSF